MLSRIAWALFGLVLGVAIASQWTTQVPAAAVPLPTTNPDELKGPRPGLMPGYLPRTALIDSLALLAPPPEPGSPEQAVDDAARLAALSSRDTPRWKLAASDAVLSFPAAAEVYACALGFHVSAAGTPHLNMLLRRTLTDAGLATYKAKDSYVRPRPFMVANDPTICTPADETALRKDGSYPSGHAALGWAWALVLMELTPQRADAIAQRGVAFGESRVICGVHWQSDVAAGRLVAAAVVGQLHANPDFTAQLAAARKEVATQAGNATTPPIECAVEQRALGMRRGP